MPETSTASKPVITRFAPSPTGSLHVGGARTALFNWAYARGRGGTFILRIEDTDAARSTAEATRGIIRDMTRLGIDWDEGPTTGSGDSTSGDWDPYDRRTQIDPRGIGPFFQSQRHEDGIYANYFQQLLDAGLAYEDEKGGGALRFKMPKHDITVHDEVLGDVTAKVGSPQMEDFIIRKGSDAGGAPGLPTYHFAVVVDDATMGVTHVIRGQEHLNNAIKHVALQDALGFDRPVYAHIPLIFNADGSKMSKRDKAKAARKAALELIETNGRDQTIEQIMTWRDAAPAQFDQTTLNEFLDKKNDEIDVATRISEVFNISLPEIDVLDFVRSGFVREVLCNYLALLGWNPGEDLEKFDNEFLKQRFEFDRCGKSNSKFDRDKLASFSGDYIRSLPQDRFLKQIENHRSNYHPGVERVSGDAWQLFCNAYQDRSETLETPFQLGAFFFADDDEVAPPDESIKPIRKAMGSNGEGFDTLENFRPILENLEPWEPQAIESAVKQYCEDNGLGMGKVAQPLRVAVSGGVVTPAIGDTLAILGKDSTLNRIDNCLLHRPGKKD